MKNELMYTVVEYLPHGKHTKVIAIIISDKEIDSEDR